MLARRRHAARPTFGRRPSGSQRLVKGHDCTHAAYSLTSLVPREVLLVGLTHTWSNLLPSQGPLTHKLPFSPGLSPVLVLGVARNPHGRSMPRPVILWCLKEFAVPHEPTPLGNPNRLNYRLPIVDRFEIDTGLGDRRQPLLGNILSILSLPPETGHTIKPPRLESIRRSSRNGGRRQQLGSMVKTLWYTVHPRLTGQDSDARVRTIHKITLNLTPGCCKAGTAVKEGAQHVPSSRAKPLSDDNASRTNSNRQQLVASLGSFCEATRLLN